MIDPPPCVLLTFAFDGSRYALFSPAEDSRTSQETNSMVPTAPTLPDLTAVSSRQENESESSGSVLLFTERFELYYESISLVFQAMHANETIGVGGCFDQNEELVLSVPELDLTLPEVSAP